MAIITEDYVSFEIAKLLKEKGFHENVNHVYHYYTSAPFYRRHLRDFNGEDYKNLRHEHYSAPTIQMAMKWMREVHKIHIIAEPCLGVGSEPNLSFNRWFWTILIESGEYKPIRQIDEFPTYEQACEAGIKYCLKNLI